MCTLSSAPVEPQSESERLILTPAHPLLADRLADYYRRNRAFLAPFEPVREPSFFTVEGQRALLDAEAEQSARDRSYHFYLARKETPDTVIGMVALNGIVRGAFQSCFLGYKLDGAHVNRGYMTEAIKAVRQFAFTGLKLHRMEANIMPCNTPSLRVAEKCGFQSEGLAKKYLRINGVWEDHIHMVLLNEV